MRALAPVLAMIALVAGLEAGAFNRARPKAGEGVWVSRSDGGVQCEPGKAESLDATADQLKSAGIEVMESRKGDDGRIRIQLCGSPSGSENAYLIPRADLEKAKKLGFQELPSASSSSR